MMVSKILDNDRTPLTKEYLEFNYITQDRSVTWISKETGWSVPKINKDIAKFRLRKTLTGENGVTGDCRLAFIDKKFLEFHYLELKKSAKNIGVEFGCSQSAILDRLYRFGIKKRKLSEYFEDLRGLQFGLLTILPDEPRMTKGRLPAQSLHCQCECGVKIWIRRANLLGGRSQSCGCIERKNLLAISRHNWCGCGELSGTQWGNVLARSKRVRREVSVTIEDAWELFEKQDRKCALTGHKLEMPPASIDVKRKIKSSSETRFASLDRIDSLKGYVHGNLQWVWDKVNIMKMDHSQLEFIDVCKAVASFHS